MEEMKLLKLCVGGKGGGKERGGGMREYIQGLFGFGISLETIEAVLFYILLPL